MGRKEAYKFTSEDAENYDFYLGCVLFEPYGKYMSSRIETTNLSAVLELACGTGRGTQYIRQALPAGVDFLATDISGDMLDIAKKRLGNDGVRLKAEDIQNLSFNDHAFDLAICQFGMMFIADRQKGFDEISRVLKPGGKLMCLTWDDVLHNPLFNLLINDLMLPYFADEDTTRLFVPLPFKSTFQRYMPTHHEILHYPLIL
ncbi:MAG TPA: class I SAM-dependent methyltransferase [Puia sp.]|nr:class I SAM-dependent methyltransferase [Puia sp.]